MHLATRTSAVPTRLMMDGTARYGGPDARVLGRNEIDGLVREFNKAETGRQQEILAGLTGIVAPKVRDDALCELCRQLSNFDKQIPVVIEAIGRIVDKLENFALVGMVASRHTDRPMQDQAMRILIQNGRSDELMNVAYIAKDVGIALWAVHELGRLRDVERLERLSGAPFMHGDRNVEEAVLTRARELMAEIRAN